MRHDHILGRAGLPALSTRQTGWIFVGLIVVGIGWMPFPFDVRMIWSMAASALLLSNAIAMLVVYLGDLRLGHFVPSPVSTAVALLSLLLGLFDVHQALNCMHVAGQM